jgi:hypothetical protein
VVNAAAVQESQGGEESTISSTVAQFPGDSQFITTAGAGPPVPDLFEVLRRIAPYGFVAVGAVWGLLAALSAASIVLWPAVTCIVSGALLKFWPTSRLTWPWSMSSAILGLMVAGYEVYFWSLLLGGSFTSLAGASTAGFAAFAVVHVLLLFTWTKPKLR